LVAARRLVAALLLVLISACGGSSRDLASYEFEAPMNEIAPTLTALAAAHSSLGRIDAHRQALRAQSEIREEAGQVTIAVPGGDGSRDMVLTFRLKPYLEGKHTMVTLTMDAPDLGEIDLGKGRFAGSKSLSREFGVALGDLADQINHRPHETNPQKAFARLFDLAAVLNDPALLARAKGRGKQEGAVDYLFANPPQPRPGDTDEGT
jgi:hypothetical protein